MTNTKKRFFLTYGKTGKITRHRLLSSAILVAKAQSIKGEDSYVDQLNGKLTKRIRFFPRKTIIRMINNKRRNVPNRIIKMKKITKKNISKKLKRLKIK